MIRYATSVDQRDFAKYASCFTDDVEVTGFSGGTMKYLDPYVDWVKGAISKYSHTHHQLGNQVVTIAGDTAHLRTYITATHVLIDDPNMLLILWGIYDDRLIRVDGDWKITHHHLERLISPRKIACEAL